MTLRAGKLSSYLAGKWLDEVVASTVPAYMALFTSDPQAAGNPLTAEIATGGYSRVFATWQRNGRLLSNTNIFLWNAIAAGTNVTHIGAFDTPTGGNFLFSGPVPVGPNSPGGFFPFATAGYLEITPGGYHVGLDS